MLPGSYGARISVETTGEVSAKSLGPYSLDYAGQKEDSELLFARWPSP